MKKSLLSRVASLSLALGITCGGGKINAIINIEDQIYISEKSQAIATTLSLLDFGLPINVSYLYQGKIAKGLFLGWCPIVKFVNFLYCVAGTQTDGNGKLLKRDLL